MIRISNITKPTKTALLIGAVLLSTLNAPAMADGLRTLKGAEQNISVGNFDAAFEKLQSFDNPKYIEEYMKVANMFKDRNKDMSSKQATEIMNNLIRLDKIRSSSN